ncbi:hypothetical protein GMJAKD_04780 [Candidatus Electrothrix aarhusensis]
MGRVRGWDKGEAAAAGMYRGVQYGLIAAVKGDDEQQTDIFPFFQVERKKASRYFLKMNAIDQIGVAAFLRCKQILPSIDRGLLWIHRNELLVIRAELCARCTDPVIAFLAILYSKNRGKAAEEHLVILDSVKQELFVRWLGRWGRCAGRKEKDKENGGEERKRFFKFLIHGLAEAK